MGRKTIQQKRLEQKIKDIDVRDRRGDLVNVHVEKIKRREKWDDGRWHQYTEYGSAFAVIFTEYLSSEQIARLKSECSEYSDGGTRTVVVRD